MPRGSPTRSLDCRSVANAIVQALEQAAKRVGKTLSKDAADAIKKMYTGAGAGIKQVVKNITEADDKHARELVAVAEKIGKNEKVDQATARSWFDDILNPKSTKDSGIEKINGRNPINSKYAGKNFDGSTWTPALQQKYPNGVAFKTNGFPEFKPYAKASVKIDGLTGDYGTDERAALRTLGLSRTPDGMVWHHVEDGETMYLIPKEVHQGVRHTGGAAILKARRGS